MRIRITLTLLLLACCVASQPARAQVVRGVLINQVTGDSLAGAYVVLLGADGKEWARELTDRRGSFSVRAPGAGEYLLRTEWIGYQSWQSDPFTLGPDEMKEGPVPVPVIALSFDYRLEDIEVAAEQTCGTRSNEGAALALLWEEAKKAMTAVQWAEERQLYSFESLQYRRYLNRDFQIETEESHTRETRRLRVFSSMSPDSLVELGFAQERGGDVFYYAPDAAVLFSDVFSSSHCFGLKVGEGAEQGLIGLAFDSRDGDVADIDGTLWLDQVTTELHHLEFQYVRLPVPTEVSNVGGLVEFKSMGDGTWVVSKWWIRTPRFVLVRGDVFNADFPQLVGYVQDGGEIQRINTEGARRTIDIGSAVLEGIVWDSIADQPLAWAEVLVVGTDYATLTNPYGRFRLDELPEGHFSVRVTHPRTRLLRIGPLERAVTLRGGRVQTLGLSLPDISRVLPELCGLRRRLRDGLIVGTVRNPTLKQAVPGVRVRAKWDDASGTGLPTTMDAVTDHEGAYVLCGLPPAGSDAVVQLTFTLPNDEQQTVEITVGSRHYYEQNLEVDYQR